MVITTNYKACDVYLILQYTNIEKDKLFYWLVIFFFSYLIVSLAVKCVGQNVYNNQTVSG